MAAGLPPVSFAAHLVRAGGEHGARDEFEKMIAQLAAVTTPGVRRVEANPGDWGIDAFAGDLGGSVVVWQSKYFYPAVTAKHQQQIRDSFRSAVRAADEHGYTVRKWVLCIPSNMDPPTTQWWDEWKQRKERAHGLSIELWDETHLTRLLLTPQADDVRRAYYDPYAVREKRDHLGTYLMAARRMAREHPYAGTLPGTVPPLATVHVCQQVSRRVHGGRGGDRGGGADSGQERGPAAESAAPLPADEALERDHSCVILAGPGGGKTSLLLMRLASGAERLLRDRGRGQGAALPPDAGPCPVPVLVQAAALSGLPLAEALAKAVSRDLGLIERLPTAFFAAPPYRGARWQVLVDGLDEMVDVVARRAVLSRLAEVAEGEHKELYRFILASRPLSGDDLDLFGTGTTRYDLQPFDDSKVQEVACAWFRQLGLPAPESLAARFMQALARTRLAGLAHVPLMTAVLCQLHAAHPDRPLPTSRGAVYGEFVDLLRKRQHLPSVAWDEASSPLAGVRRCVSGAVEYAEAVLDHLHDLVAHLAAARYAGDARPALELVEHHPLAAVPHCVPKDDWRAFLETALRRSGLLTVKSGDLAFLHQTLLEYFAARYATRDAVAREATLAMLFRRRGRRGPFPPPGLTAGFGRAHPKPPKAEASFVGFVCDASVEAMSGDEAGAAPFLRRLATRGGLDGAKFIMEQVGLGTSVPDDVLASVTEMLAELACGPVKAGSLSWGAQDEAVVALTCVSNHLAPDLFDSIARNPTTDDWQREQAALVLQGLDGARGADLLYDLASGLAHGGYRVYAALRLAEAEDPRAAGLLHGLALDSSINERIYDRVYAARALAELGDLRAVGLLRELARDAEVVPVSRLEAALFLAHSHSREVAMALNPEPGRAVGADLLHELALDTALDRHRVDAALNLVVLGDSRAADLLHQLGHDVTLDADRLEAARALVEYGDPRGVGLLYELARETTLNDSLRVEAAAMLLARHEPEVARTLSSFVAARKETSAGATVPESLDETGRADVVDLLCHLAQGTTLDSASAHHERLRAAIALAELGDLRAADILHGLVQQTDDQDPMACVAAARALVRCGDSRAAEVLYQVSQTHSWLSTRLHAIKELAEVDDPRAVDLLYELARGGTTPMLARLRAAEVRRRHGGYDRLKAAGMLVGLGDPRAADLLLTLTHDWRLTDLQRLSVARALAELPDHRGAARFERLLRKRSLRRGERRREGRKRLRWTGWEFGRSPAPRPRYAALADPALLGLPPAGVNRALLGESEPEPPQEKGPGLYRGENPVPPPRKG